MFISSRIEQLPFTVPTILLCTNNHLNAAWNWWMLDCRYILLYYMMHYKVSKWSWLILYVKKNVIWFFEINNLNKLLSKFETCFTVKINNICFIFKFQIIYIFLKFLSKKFVFFKRFELIIIINYISVWLFWI